MSASNVLVIMSDEHTPSVLGAYGNPIVQTPNLDRLAASGLRFDHAYTPSPICIPARASFATGKPVFEHRCWSSAEPYYGQWQSWMHRLRERGHEVVSIGKLHYRSAADDCGFSQSLLPMYLANEGRGWPQGLQRKPMGDFPEAAEMASILGPGETTYTRYDRDIAATAADWLSKPRGTADRPWVLFVSFVCPHFPLSAPRPFYDLYRNAELPQPFDRDPTAWPRHPVLEQMRAFWNYADYFDAESEARGLRNYYALCSFLDANVARVLAALDTSGQRERTRIIYTSDHGDQVGNHGIWGKSFMYEDSVRIPMILSGPGIEPGSNHTPVSLLDLATTIEASVGAGVVPAQADWQGRPLSEFIAAPEPERSVLSEYHDGGSPCGCFMLRKGRFKYVYFAEDNPPLLFDLVQDPCELDNLATDDRYVDALATARAELYRMLDPEAVNREAFADQAAMIDALGGLDTIRALPSFNHTPLDGA